MISEVVVGTSEVDVVDVVVAASVRFAGGSIGGVAAVVLCRAPRIQKIALRANREED
jgi:acetyl-CoA carboxylase beta subunit